MKLRKKPVEIDGVQYANNEFADNPATFREELPDWLVAALMDDIVYFRFEGEDYWYGYIHTLEGQMRFGPDDWVLRGVNGELYPCKPDILDKTYDRI